MVTQTTFFTEELVSPFEKFQWKVVNGSESPDLYHIDSSPDLYQLKHETMNCTMMWLNPRNGKVTFPFGIMECLVAHTLEEFNHVDTNFEVTFRKAARSGENYFDSILGRIVEARNIIMRELNVPTATAEEYMVFSAIRIVPMYELLQYSPVAIKFLLEKTYSVAATRRARAVSSLTTDEEEFKFLCENLSDEVIESFLH